MDRTALNFSQKWNTPAVYYAGELFIMEMEIDAETTTTVCPPPSPRLVAEGAGRSIIAQRVGKV